MDGLGLREWTLGELLDAAALEYAATDGVSTCRISTLTDDSRRAIAGSCFIAINGVDVDGHRFLRQAFERGASAAVVQRDRQFDINRPLVRVADTRSAIARLAAAYFGIKQTQRANRLRLIGVTGTNGKTTVCTLIDAILRAEHLKVALLGTVENRLAGEAMPSAMTTPPPLELCQYLARAVHRGATHGVLEVSSHALDQRRCDGLTSSAAVFTNLTHDHLDYHASLDDYAASKRRLFDGLGDDSAAIVSADDPIGEFMIARCRGRVVRYSCHDPSAEVGVNKADLRGDGCELSIRLGDERLPLITPLVGGHNVSNVVAAAATCWAMGVSLDAIQRGLSLCAGARGRLERVSPPGHPFSVFVDYAHTPDALRAVLQALRPVTRGRLICVFGCGGDRDRAKRPVMGELVSRLADVAIITSDNPRGEDPVAIIDNIRAGIGHASGCNVTCDVDRREAIRMAVEEASPGDVVLIAGKGHETYQIIGDERFAFDDRQVVRELIAACPEALGPV